MANKGQPIKCQPATPAGGPARGSQPRPSNQWAGQRTSGHLLSPDSAALAGEAAASRRRSTLSNQGFFIEHSRRLSSAAAAQQEEHQRQHAFLRAFVSPVHAGGAAGGATTVRPPVHGPAAMAGSRKTSIFDPVGHSLAAAAGAVQHQHLLASDAAGHAPRAPKPSPACALNAARRRSTMTAAALKADAGQQIVSAAKSHSVSASALGARNAAARRQTLMQQVPVIGCSPTSIQASLRALDDSRRHERLLKRLLEHQSRSAKRRQRRAGLSPRARPLHRAVREAVSRRLTLNRSSPLDGAGPAAHQLNVARLSVSSLSLASLTSTGSQSTDSCESDSDTLPTSGSDSGGGGGGSLRDAPPHPTGGRSLVRRALRKLASLSASSPSVAVRRSTRSVPPVRPSALNYWHYYYYLRETRALEPELELAADAASSFGAGSGQRPSADERRARLSTNYSLARLEILNSACAAAAAAGSEQRSTDCPRLPEKPEASVQEEQVRLQRKAEVALQLVSGTASPGDPFCQSATDVSMLLSTSSSCTSADDHQSDSGSGCPRRAASSSVCLSARSSPLWTPADSRSSSAAGSLTSLSSGSGATGGRAASGCERARREPRARRRARQEEPEEDDFDRLSRCHRGYKPPQSIGGAGPAAGEREAPWGRSPDRGPAAHRLSVRSGDRPLAWARGRPSRADPSSDSQSISMSWNTLDTAHEHRLRAPGRAARPADDAGEARAASVRRCTSAQLRAGPPHRHCEGGGGPESLAVARRRTNELAHLNISTNDLERRRSASRSQLCPPGCEAKRQPEANLQGARRRDKWPRSSLRLARSNPAEEHSVRVRAQSTGARSALEASRQSSGFGARTPPRAGAGRPGKQLPDQAQSAATSSRCGAREQPEVAAKSEAANGTECDEEDSEASQEEKLRLFHMIQKASFTCYLVGARQTGKQSIVKCFVKLLDEFKLATAELRREKILTQLLGCSEHLQEILRQQEEQQQQQQQQQQQESGGLGRRLRLNSWLPSNKLLGSAQTGSRQRRFHSTCLVSQQQQQQQQAQQTQRNRLNLASRNSCIGSLGNTGVGEDAGASATTKASEGRFLCVASPYGINRSDSNISYHSTQAATRQEPPEEESAGGVRLQVPSTPTAGHQPASRHSSADWLASEAKLAGRRSDEAEYQQRKAQEKLSRLLSLKKLNKRRIYVKFSSRRKLGSRLEPHQLPDAFLVLYALNDRDSFEFAKKTVKQIVVLRQRDSSFRSFVPVILVANKIDLERAKAVKSEEGRAFARAHGCKFMDVSCTVGHNLDSLLTGIRNQLVIKHHLALNSFFDRKSGEQSGGRKQGASNSDGPKGKRRSGKTGSEPAAKQTKASQNIIVRFYRRYVTDNNQDNYDCDNFSKL